MQTQETRVQESLAQINFKLPSEMKNAVERAAIASGQSLRDFAIQTLVERANEVLEQQQARTLTDRDRDVFLALLDSDAGPNEALRQAAEDYKRYLNQP